MNVPITTVVCTLPVSVSRYLNYLTCEACSDGAGRQMTGPGLKIDGPVPEYSITLGPGPE